MTRLMGKETPRLSTEPLGPLNKKTSLGFECIEFVENVLCVTLLPWQKYLLTHALELDSNGDFRFRTIVTLVARQNGKTHLLKCLALWMLYTGRVRTVLGAAQSLDIARESWSGAVEMAEDDQELKSEISAVRRANGEQELKLHNGARYKIAAATRSAGRGLSVDLLILDELREHRTWEAWGALSKTTMARPNGLTFCISNAGDDQSIVLNQLREKALAGSDSSLAIFEWSAEENAELDNREAWAQANPGLGHTITEQALASSLSTDPPAVFRTEVLCTRVESLDGAVDLGAWKSCLDASGSLGNIRERVIVALDVAPDGRHVTLCGAAQLDDGRTRVEVLAAWDSTSAARFELKTLVERIKPAAVAWFPSGPAAALAADLRDLGAVEIKGVSVTESCQEFADLVVARRVLHPGDPLLDAHVAGASKLHSGDGWRFTRRGVGHVDALYAAAGAIHTARTLPVEVPAPRSAVF